MADSRSVCRSRPPRCAVFSFSWSSKRFLIFLEMCSWAHVFLRRKLPRPQTCRDLPAALRRTLCPVAPAQTPQGFRPAQARPVACPVGSLGERSPGACGECVTWHRAKLCVRCPRRPLIDGVGSAVSPVSDFPAESAGGPSCGVASPAPPRALPGFVLRMPTRRRRARVPRGLSWPLGGGTLYRTRP